MKAFMLACQCESNQCDHDEDSCERSAVRPAPVQFLEGSDMCEDCIAHYVRAGYGKDSSPHWTDEDYRIVFASKEEYADIRASLASERVRAAVEASSDAGEYPEYDA